MFRSIATTYRAAFSGLPPDVWRLGGVMVVNRAGAMVLPFIALYLTRERGFEITTAGRLLSLYGVGSVVGAWLGGWACDRIGSDRVLRVSLGGSGFVYLWLGIQQELWTITVGVFVLAVVSEAFRPAAMSAMADRSPARLRVRAFALLRLAANLGVGIGPAIGGLLALHDYRLLFVADGLTCWIAAWLVFRFPASAGGQGPISSDSQAPARSPFADLPYLMLLLWVTALAIVFFQLFSTLPLYFSEVYGFREDAIGLLLALNAAIIVLFEMVLIHRAERYDRMTLVGLGAVLVCLGFGLMPFGASAVWAAFTIVIWTLGEMLALPLLNAVVAERAATSQRGRYMGLYTMAYSVAFVIAPGGGAWIYATYGPDVLWFGAGGLALPLMAGAWVLRGSFRGTADAKS
jgi:predicted MFS family arabinose efflux permease